jgi:hypothetical protein
MLNAIIKAEPCGKNHYQYQFFHPQCKGKLFLRAVTATLSLNFRIRWRRTVSFTLWPATSLLEEEPSVLGWAKWPAPSAGLDIDMEQRKLPCPNEGLSSSNYKSMFI